MAIRCDGKSWMHAIDLVYKILLEEINMEKKIKVYLGGDIMTKGSNLARQEEYDEFVKRGLDVDVYSPVMNKSINDKSNMTEEENNHLAEKIVKADTDRLWESDAVVMCPEQSAIGSMCETGILYGWKYMANELKKILVNGDLTTNEKLEQLDKEIDRIRYKLNYYHYFDIRTNHLNEKDWRRSFSINQFLYGAILGSTNSKNPEGIDTFDEILDELEERFPSSKPVTINNAVEFYKYNKHGRIVSEKQIYSVEKEMFMMEVEYEDGNIELISKDDYYNQKLIESLVFSFKY